MSQEDNVREVKFRRYRVSPKGPRDSEQGAEVQELNPRAKTTADDKNLLTRERYGQKHGATVRKTTRGNI